MSSIDRRQVITLVVRAGHQEVERRVLSSGTHTFNVYVDPVETVTLIKIWRSDLREQPLERLGTQVEVLTWELVTLRVEALHT